MPAPGSGLGFWAVLRRRASAEPPPPGSVRFGDLRRLRPVSERFGFDRGKPIDRYYIEDFLSRHRGDIRGHVLEVGDPSYTRRFGAGVTRSEVVDPDESNPHATIVADLGQADEIESETFDCVICTQVLLLIFDVRAAITTLERILRPGGVLLATVPGITKVSRGEAELWGDYWRFTAQSVRRLFEEVFPPGAVQVEARGNVLAAVAFLHGLAAEELSRRELDAHDPDFEVTVAVRAAKAPA
jgi:SAM-dependent methyltransferase